MGSGSDGGELGDTDSSSREDGDDETRSFCAEKSRRSVFSKLPVSYHTIAATRRGDQCSP